MESILLPLHADKNGKANLHADVMMSSILLSNQSKNRACGRPFQQISKQHAEIYASHRAQWRHSGAAAGCVAAQQEGHGFESGPGLPVWNLHALPVGSVPVLLLVQGVA